MKRILSVFDYSGNWPEYFFRKGDDVITWDIKNGQDINFFDYAATCIETLEDIDGILAAVPCTDFANSGSQYWKIKDKDGRTEASMALVRRTLEIVDLFIPSDPDFDGTFFWAIENPIGRIGKLFPELPRPISFDPCDYAGYLDISDSQHNE